MLNYNYYDYPTTNNLVGLGAWMIVSIVVAIIGGILVYFLFLDKKNEGKYSGFLKYLYEFLSFKKFWLESILKISYLIFSIYVTLLSFGFIGTSFISFLLILVVGNLALRLTYEFSLVLLTICRNTTEINLKMKNKDKKEN